MPPVAVQPIGLAGFVRIGRLLKSTLTGSVVLPWISGMFCVAGGGVPGPSLPSSTA